MVWNRFDWNQFKCRRDESGSIPIEHVLKLDYFTSVEGPNMDHHQHLPPVSDSISCRPRVANTMHHLTMRVKLINSNHYNQYRYKQCINYCCCIQLTSLHEAPFPILSNQASVMTNTPSNPPVTSRNVSQSPFNGEWMMLTACPSLPGGFSGPWGASFSQCCRKDNSPYILNTCTTGGWRLLLATPSHLLYPLHCMEQV